MADKMYLSDVIALTPDNLLTASVEAIGGIEQYKTGTQYRKVTFVFPSSGRSITEGIFEFHFQKNLSGLKVGDTVEMKNEPDKNGKLWPAFKIIKTTETSTNQTQNNTQQVKAETIATKAVQVNDTEKLAYDYKLGLAGIVQAMLIRGMNDSQITGEQIKDAPQKTAEEWVIWIRDKSKLMANGISTPTHSPELLAKVESVFGTDDRPPLPDTQLNAETYNG